MEEAPMRYLALLVLAVTGLQPLWAADTVTVKAPAFQATITRGVLTGLRAGGKTLIAGGDAGQLTGLLRVAGSHWVAAGSGAGGTVTAKSSVSQTHRDLSDLPGSTLKADYALRDGELSLTQQARSPQPGVQSVQWGLGCVPFSYDVIVPGNSGIRIQRTSPGNSWEFAYPMTWEAGLVILQGPGHGCYVWAEDAAGRFKKLTVRRAKTGWTLAFATENPAPFAALTTAQSARWRLGVYQGDWRVPARRYRDWAERTWKLARRAQRTPAWAQDIRFVVIMGQERAPLKELAARVDPRQTLLYIPAWRKFDYDRMYPDFTANDDFPAFVQDAHQLGFRVMPHVNYFGCDPKRPEYATFERYQVRNPLTHEKEWWLWDRADPVIKFAYINPACQAWRELFISRMKELVARYQVDALHLDQTLCIYNDDNGLVDGLTMVQGNVALHRELHEALPQVALSGEGLDEVTMRYEAFAQRHAYGLDFIEGTWDRKQLAMAFPVSSYLFLNYTQPYGYLGFTTPQNGQLYAAWRENYQHWGVLPTLPAYGATLGKPSGFLSLLLDEAAAFTQHRLDPDLDGPWPADVFFPYRGRECARAAYRDTASGTSFALTVGGKTREVSRIVTGVSELTAPGSLPGWKCYDEKRLFGLLPERWYPYSPAARDLAAFHVCALPEGFAATRVTATALGAQVDLAAADGALAWLADLTAEATCGSVPDEGKPHTQVGGLDGSGDGAVFMAQGRNLFAHPPWKAPRKNPQTGATEANGTGRVYATFAVNLPEGVSQARFRCEVAMDKGAIGEGKTDGVLYSVAAEATGVPPASAEAFNATATPEALDLDLSAFRGKRVQLTLTADPGPKRSPAFDWARWYSPRIEVEHHGVGTVALAGAPPYRLALASAGEVQATRAGDVSRFVLDLPGSVILLRDEPALAELPLDLLQAPLTTTFLSDSGEALTNPQFAGAVAGPGAVGGVERPGLNVHPPDHGLTVVDYPLRLPAQAARFHCYVGLRDGSKSDGCGFRVAVNGKPVGYRHMLPGRWEEITADLSPWAGKPIVLSLVTDSEGPFNFDWAIWGEPRLTAAP
jgi:hypothetical protein